MNDVDQLRAVLDEKLEPIHKQLDDVHKAVFIGDGRPPILERLATLEARPPRKLPEGFWKVMAAVAVAVITLVGGILWTP
jgi:hypothetical protein